ncbi:Ribosome biogenesis protein nsa1 (NOP7-associated protein 1) [Spiromyces aspiralis]|uniref:Ribosome biogenesis protein nsa1 (NOP7-associated protein 1) n=1 Tax=Spiromyces aspiralis TaxID=68401 RepID=A0ACC1I0U2_9FUNG|nr:Ribosome biogenesis protein nsa1 (NOP7-associated protein 1) [Spiromyces aspiralis]
MGRVRTKTVKKASRVLIEKYYPRLTKDFQTNKRICDEVALIASKRLRNKIAGFTTHLMRRIERGPVRGISFKLQEEERERKDNYVPEVSALALETIEVDPDTRDMLKALNFESIDNLSVSAPIAQVGTGRGDRRDFRRRATDLNLNITYDQIRTYSAKKAKTAGKESESQHQQSKRSTKRGTEDELEKEILTSIKTKRINGDVDKAKAIHATSWLYPTATIASDNGEALQMMGVARKDGTVQVIDIPTGEVRYTYQDQDLLQEVKIRVNGNFITEKKFIGVDITPTHFVTCTNLGRLRFQKWSSTGEEKEVEEEEEDEDAAVKIQLPFDISRMVTHPKQQHLFLVGGREHQLRLWDINRLVSDVSPRAERGNPNCWVKPKSNPIFEAQNVDPDFLGLRVPIWITDIAYLRESANTADHQPTNFITSTNYHQIRIYDTRTSRQPVKDWEFGEYPIKRVAVSPTGNDIFYADTTGKVGHIDIRTGKEVGQLKGFAGAVTSLCLNIDGKYLATVGLDRFLRIHETTSADHKLRHKVYLKQRMTHVVVDWEAEHKEQAEAERKTREAEEAVWDDMEKVGNSNIAGKRKRSAKIKK